MSERSNRYRELETLFLDVGNTLISMDFTWIRAELARRGVECEVEALRRAEAAARPVVSTAVARLASTEGTDVFALYLRASLERLETAQPLSDGRLEELVEELVPVLGAPGMTERLWSAVLPGVREALTSLRDLGLRMVVVSNSDGTVEHALTEHGLRPYFEAVLDSHVVGFEKPDPRIFQHALEISGSRPERTLHVGDMYHADVAGARSAGIDALLLDPYDVWTDVDCARAPNVAAVSREIVAAKRRT